MARSPFFMFFVVLLVVVAFVMVVSFAQFNKPTDPVYYNTSSSINQTQGFIDTSLTQSVSWAASATFIALAVVLIATLVLLKRR